MGGPEIIVPDKKEIIQVFEDLNLDLPVMKHSVTVNKIALKISEALLAENVPLKTPIINAGSLLHDIGRTRVNDISHGVVGGEIIARLGYHNDIKRIAETHVLGGFTVIEAQELGLPARDYRPVTLEEKICCYADKLCIEDRQVSLKYRFQKWASIYGETPLIIEAYGRLRIIEDELKSYGLDAFF